MVKCCGSYDNRLEGAVEIDRVESGSHALLVYTSLSQTHSGAVRKSFIYGRSEPSFGDVGALWKILDMPLDDIETFGERRSFTKSPVYVVAKTNKGRVVGGAWIDDQNTIRVGILPEHREQGVEEEIILLAGRYAKMNGIKMETANPQPSL